MKTITVREIMRHGPCDDYPRSRVKQLINNGKSFAAYYAAAAEREWQIEQFRRAIRENEL